MTEQAGEPPRAPQVDWRQHLLIGGMLVVIIALLAALWVRERRARIRAQADAAVLRRRLRTVQAFGKLPVWAEGMPASLPFGEGGEANSPASAPAKDPP